MLDECPRIFLLDEDADEPHLPSVADGLSPLPLPAAPGAQQRGTPHDLAYILFTSGSTGTPKGVPISHANADAYVTGQLQLDEKWPGARYVQLCELGFDRSVHDMFVCWGNGGCLYVPQTVDPLHNAGFINDHAIPHWNGVPSVAGFMQQLRNLTPNKFPSLRLSLFGGEPLPRALALALASRAGIGLDARRAEQPGQAHVRAD